MADPVLRLLGTGTNRKHSTSDSLSSEAARKLTNLQIPTGSSLANLRDGSPAAPVSARPGASRAPSRATSVGGTPEPSGVRQGMARRGTTAAGSVAGETATARGEEDAEDSDLDEGDFGNAQAATAAVSHQEAVAEKMRMRMLLESFDEQQMARYEVFRRVGLNKNAVKRLANHVLNQSVTQNVAVVIAGASKVFVGELVERARAIQQVRGETGPLSPDCLREAYRQYKQTGLVPQSKPSKRMFR